MAREGYGADLLARQSPLGFWGTEDPYRMVTTYALALLRWLGADPEAPDVRLAIERVNEHVAWHQLDGRPYFEGETEPCLNGAILASGAYFGFPSGRLVDRLLGDQLADGGWNCDAPESACSSFHSTICVLEGLLAYERSVGPSATVTAARERAHQYLLERRLFRSLRTGEVIDRAWTRFSFPPRYHYDVLRGLDYLRSAGVAREERMDEAIDLVRKRRHQNGLWPLYRRHTGGVELDVDPGVGKPSRWNTLRALRVLGWAGFAPDRHWQRIESEPRASRHGTAATS